jgi:hypothetical protein
MSSESIIHEHEEKDMIELNVFDRDRISKGSRFDSVFSVDELIFDFFFRVPVCRFLVTIADDFLGRVPVDIYSLPNNRRERHVAELLPKEGSKDKAQGRMIYEVRNH